MKDSVVIKSYQNGITLLLKEEPPFEQLLQEISCKFTAARSFFGEAKTALAFEGRKLTKTEEISILETIQSCCDINILCIAGRDEETEKRFVQSIRQAQQTPFEEAEGQFYRGTLKNRETIETESSIIILGDVYPGSTIVSARNIIILGGLYGEAYAGGNGDAGHYVVALEMKPEKLKIGDFKYKLSTRQTKWGIRPRIQPKIAYVNNERIVFEPLTKELLDCL